MCSGTHWSTLLHSCDGDNTMLPYQEWSKRALLGFYKLLFSKQTDTSETGMWKRTDISTKPARVASFVTKSDWILSHCCHSKEWVTTDRPVHESLIDMDFSWELTNNTTEFYCNAHCCDESLTFAMCLLRTFMYFLPFIPFCFYQSSAEVYVDWNVSIWAQYPLYWSSSWGFFVVYQHIWRRGIFTELKNPRTDHMSGG